MDYLKFYLIIVLSGLCFLSVNAQEKLKGQLLDEDSKDPIEGSHVLNLSNKTMAVSNQEGQFTIQAQAFDTILITNINYHRKQFIIKEASSVVIYLSPSIIELDEVEVSNIQRYSSVFSENLKNQNTKKLKIHGLPQAKPMAEIPPLFQEDNSLRFWENGRILPPLSYDIYLIPKLLNRKYKAKMKYYALKAEKDKNIKADKKLNRERVQELVKLEGDLLTDFIDFMDLTEDFIKKSNDYELAIYIKKKYNEFMHFGE